VILRALGRHGDEFGQKTADAGGSNGWRWRLQKLSCSVELATRCPTYDTFVKLQRLNHVSSPNIS
jgi:hypothetical protein